MCGVVNIITQITQIPQMIEVGIFVQRKKKSFAYGIERIETVTGSRRLLRHNYNRQT